MAAESVEGIVLEIFNQFKDGFVELGSEPVILNVESENFTVN